MPIRRFTKPRRTGLCRTANQLRSDNKTRMPNDTQRSDEKRCPYIVCVAADETRCKARLKIVRKCNSGQFPVSGSRRRFQPSPTAVSYSASPLMNSARLLMSVIFSFYRVDHPDRDLRPFYAALLPLRHIAEYQAERQTTIPGPCQVEGGGIPSKGDFQTIDAQ